MNVIVSYARELADTKGIIETVMGFGNAIKPLVSTKERRTVLLAVTAAYTLVQLSALPVALAVPSLADVFNTDIQGASWVIIVYLLVLGSLVLVAARLGDRYGHSRVFMAGLIVSTIAAGFMVTSTSLLQVIMWRALTGLGSALVMGNANALLAEVFPAEERGRAFSVPFIGARFGTLTGLVLFGVFLTFLSWKLIFLSFLHIGILGIILALPMVKTIKRDTQTTKGSIDYLGSLLLIATGAVLVLSGNHLHGGEESFVSEDGLRYHLPMHALFLLMVGVFILLERKVSNPVVELEHFNNKYFSLSVVSNAIFHMSMLATLTLVPVLVERGFGKDPVWVSFVLFPNQVMGIIMPFIAGWIYDRYNPKLLRPLSIMSIAIGFFILGTLAGNIPIWGIPILMIPISIGSSMFAPINNAAVMSSLSLTNRGFASGMLETSREMGHALGGNLSATVLAVALPLNLALLSSLEAQPFYIEGFRLASLVVVLTLLAGTVLAYFHKSYTELSEADQLVTSTTTRGD